MRDGLDFGGGANGLVGGETTLRVDQVRREDGVDQGGLSQAGLTLDGELAQLKLVNIFEFNKNKRSKEK